MISAHPPTTKLHAHPVMMRRWVVFGLALGPVVALGLSRFAYALLLPAMRSDLGWSFADAGALNTANAARYLAGALVAAPVGRRIGPKAVFGLALFLTAIVTGSSGLWLSVGILIAAAVVAAFQLGPAAADECPPRILETSARGRLSNLG